MIKTTPVSDWNGAGWNTARANRMIGDEWANFHPEAEFRSQAGWESLRKTTKEAPSALGADSLIVSESSY
jgi:hypothetical protein